MRYASERLLAHDAMAFVLAGGRGSRLRELTDRRAKPAVHFGGGARIIDFVLSNAVNSGIRRIGIATQYRAGSLDRYIRRNWASGHWEPALSLDILPACALGRRRGYGGTADAVFRNIDAIARHAPKHVVILAADHIYKMDYEPMLRQHVASGADMTVGCIAVKRSEANGFGVMAVDRRDVITAFVEKPRNPPAIPGDPDRALASMGIYVFDTGFLIDQLRRDAATAGSTHDFGGDIVPFVVRHGKAVAHHFAGSCVGNEEGGEAYWRDVGTVDAYFRANLDVATADPRLDMHDRDWPLWSAPFHGATRTRDDGKARRGDRERASVSGCNVLSHDTQIGHSSCLEEAVILPHCRIGKGARLSRVILDSGVRIPEGLVVGEDPELDAKRFRRTENGVCLITRPMIARLEHLIPQAPA